NDDAFDYDMGWRGKGQFWFTIQSADAGSDRCGEFDGGTTPQTGLPYATPVIFNATTLGRGATTGTTRMYTFRDNAGGKFYNSILSEQNRAVDIELRGNSDDSYGRFQAGDLKLESNVFWDMASNNVNNQITIAPIAGSFANAADSTTQVAAARADVQAYFTTAKNKVANPKFVSVSRGAGLQLLDPRAVAFEVYDGLAAYPAGDAFFTPVEYKGAFGPDCADFWADKWTYMDFLRYFPATCADVTDVEDVLPAIASLVAYPNPNNGTFTLSADKVGNEPVEISVYNLVGAQILVRKVTPVAGMINETIELGNVAAGIYVLKARQGDQVSALRVDVK
ncbi:MAG: T9SS C-terminal target domain-containing protein, partial [Bacteroidetes bacterium]